MPRGMTKVWTEQEVVLEFTPAVYEHAASFLNRSPWEVSRHGGLLADAHTAAFQHYRHTPVVIGIDLYNVEAEAYGASVVRPEGNLPPSVEERCCQALDDLLALPLLDPERDGRIPMILEAAVEVRRRLPEADVRVPISGPFSIASTLLGFEPLLYALLADPEQGARALTHLAHGQRAFSRAAAGMDLEVLVFESSASPPLLSPALFREAVLPSLRSVMEGAAEACGRRVGCILGGNTVPILDSLLETGPSFVICPMETDRHTFMEVMRSHPEVSVRINTPPEMFLSGPWERLERELAAAAELARGRPRTVVGTGVLAYETDPALVLRASEFVRSIR
jgi:uroporphyrinogen decarboxylase